MKVVTRNLELIPEINIKGICSPEEMLFFDIETTGLKKETTQVYLIGCVFYEEECWKIRQWLAQNSRDEEYILDSFLEFASRYQQLVHFNGDGFDIPYLNYKTGFYMLGSDLSRFAGFDIYKHARTARKLLGLSSMSQKSIETFLGIEREDLYNGGALIPIYYDYEKTGRQDLEHLLLLHNFDDLQGMLKILPILSYEGILQGEYAFCKSGFFRDRLVLEYRLQTALPRAFEAFRNLSSMDEIRIAGDGSLLQIHLKFYEGKARMNLEPVSDYYYLPGEDRAIHKDVAAFVDKSRRVKATKKNCYVTKDGRFLPCPDGWKGRVFYHPAQPGQALIDWEDIPEEEKNDVFLRFAQSVLGTFVSC